MNFVAQDLWFGPDCAFNLDMSSYYSVQDQEQFRSYGYIKISIAWLMGALSIWMWANAHDSVMLFFWVYVAYLVATKFLAVSGWADYARSKGYSKWYGLLSFVAVIGPLALIFMPDKWFEQETPKLEMKRLSW